MVQWAELSCFGLLSGVFSAVCSVCNVDFKSSRTGNLVFIKLVYI